MSNVTKLDDHRPHKVVYVACIGCGKDWNAVAPVDHEGMYECPDCGHMAGEIVDHKNFDFFKRYTEGAKDAKDKHHRTMVLLNDQKNKGDA